MEKDYSLHLLGRFELQSATRGEVGISAKKSRALLSYLALSPDGTASRDRLASLLWSDTELQFAKTNLRQCLSALRKQIDNKTSGLVRNEGDQLQLHLEQLRIDTDLLDSLNDASVDDALLLIPDLNRGALLPDFPAIDSQFDEWLDRQRYQLQDRYCRALEQILVLVEADRLAANKDVAVTSGAAKKLAQEILEVEIANEKAHACLVRHYLGVGDRAAALRQYRLCEKVLADQLDVEPGKDVKVLIETVRQSASAVTGKAVAPGFEVVEVEADTSEDIPSSREATDSTDTPRLDAELLSIQPVSTMSYKIPFNNPRPVGRFTEFIAGLEGNIPRAASMLIALLVVVVVAVFLYPQKDTVSEVPIQVATRSVHPESFEKFTEPAKCATRIPAPVQLSIAVIPFQNLGDDPGQLYLSDGLSEDLVTEISRVSGLQVIASQSSFLYRDALDNMEFLEDSLNVDYVLSGSVRRINNDVRITAHLIRTQDASYIWSDKFDRGLNDILRVQDEITRHIVSSLQVGLTESESQRLSMNREVSAEAYYLLLRGLHPFS